MGGFWIVGVGFFIRYENNFLHRIPKLRILTRACWIGTISFETYWNTENSCCGPWFPLMTSCWKIVRHKGRKRTFYLQLRNPEFKTMRHITVLCKALVCNVSTLPLTSTRMNTVILLPLIGRCICQSDAAETTAPGWLWLFIDRPQPFLSFSAAIPVLKALTAQGFRHLQCFPCANIGVGEIFSRGEITDFPRVQTGKI